MRKTLGCLVLILVSSKIIAGTCYISGSNISFEKYDRTRPSPTDATGTFFVTCNDNASYNFCIIINATRASPNRVLTRTSGAIETLNYELYSNAYGGTIWQNGTPGVCYTNQNCPYNKPTPCQYSIYGRIPTGQNKPTATYQDTITVNLDINTTPKVTYAQTYISTGCSISADLFNFGNYDPTASDLLIQATNLHVNCTLGASQTYTISLSAGNSGNVNARYLLSGTNQLPYNFYTDIARTNIWNVSAPFSWTGAIQNYTIYGKISAGQNVPAGSYMDTITATVTYP
jgi:spore coat protein U-like protein